MDAHGEIFLRACSEYVFPYTLSFFSLERRRAASHKNSRWLNRNPCVYFLFLGDDLAYIGSTTHLTYRISAHCSNKMKFDSVMIVPFHQFGLNEQEIRWAENRAIRHFRPIRNTYNNPDWKKEGRSWVYLPDLTEENRTA